MGIRQVQIEQKTNFEKSLLILDEAISILRRIQKRDEEQNRQNNLIFRDNISN